MKKWKCSMIGMILVLMLAACGAENESQEVTPTDEANTEATTGADNIEESTEAPAEETSAEIPTAEELLKQVSESSSSIESYSMDTNITQNITMAVDGQEQTQDVEMNMKQDMVLSPIAVYQEISTSLPAESGAQEIKQYITEDAIYSHVEGSWMKLLRSPLDLWSSNLSPKAVLPNSMIS